MPRIVSVSRRTDIPAFYSDWFMHRLEEGYAGYVNPFGGQKYIVPLKPEDVIAFVFWSKNFAPFIRRLRDIEKAGYSFYFNYTITGLPSIFESSMVETGSAIDSLRELSRMFLPRHINWRYDPIIISDITGYDYHIRRFGELAGSLEGSVERCYISFVQQYKKVQRNFARLKEETGVEIQDPSMEDRLQLAEELADIAIGHGIRVMSCCGDYLVGGKIEKAHCVDHETIQKLYGSTRNVGRKPTRKECGCSESVDIGAYDTCPHGCLYCYANANREVASGRYDEHDPQAAFLGYSKEQSDGWVSTHPLFT